LSARVFWFVGKTLPKDKFPPGIIVRVQERGWITEEPILQWLSVVWKRQPGALLHKCGMLVVGFRQLSWTYDRKGESKS
jgi:hypothetical protein